MKTGIAIAILWVTFCIYMVTDAPLKPEVKKWLSWQPKAVPEAENGFIYFMGLPAEASENPLVIGQLRTRGMNSSQSGIYSPYEDYPLNKWLPNSEASNICSSEDENCIQQHFRGCEAEYTISEQGKILLQRYRTLLAYRKFSTPLSGLPDFDTVEYFRSGNHLSLQQIAREAECGSREQAINMLLAEIHKVRHHMVIADNIVYKIGLIVLIHQQYEFITELARRDLWIPSKEENVKEIFALLSVSERSLDGPLGRELNETLTSLSVDRMQEESGATEFWMPWVFHLLVKQNMIRNRAAIPLLLGMQAVKQSSDRYQKPSIPEDWSAPQYYNIRNIGGEILAAVAFPRFINIGDSIHEINLSIRLAELMIFEQEAIRNNHPEQVPTTLRNPFDGSVPVIDESGKKLCFSTPGKEPKDYICTRLFEKARIVQTN